MILSGWRKTCSESRTPKEGAVMTDFLEIAGISFTPFDLLPQTELREKLAGLVLNGPPRGLTGTVAEQLQLFRNQLNNASCDNVRIVVFGGGSGLSNIIGGDSRQDSWPQRPFEGLKRVFPQTRSVVCVTDNGGSTGEMLKDLDMIAIGDIRHVLLSSVQAVRLQKKYQLLRKEVQETVERLARIFNFRFDGPLSDDHHCWEAVAADIQALPDGLRSYFETLVDFLKKDEALSPLLRRSHCLGNLLIAAVVFQCKRQNDTDLHHALYCGLNELAGVIGAGERAALPCTSTPAGLLVRYANGVEIPGEHKLETARRGVPVAGARVEYCGEVRVDDGIFQDIAEADIILCAPGSLYSSIIPVLQTPGIADAIRQNRQALKMLVSNIWVQEGETDLVFQNPDRRFYVSDMIQAYERNIPGGTAGLFKEILCVSLRDIPASILQRYAVEGKMPIYVDRQTLIDQGFVPVECDIFSSFLLRTRGVIQHDAFSLARVLRGLFHGKQLYQRDWQDQEENTSFTDRGKTGNKQGVVTTMLLPQKRYQALEQRIAAVDIVDVDSSCPVSASALRDIVIDILWDNPVIPLPHLDYFSRVELVANRNWNREQKWDNVFSYFDPEDCSLKIRAEELTSRQNIELAFFVALGESLLGNYALHKEIKPVLVDGQPLGRVYRLHLRSRPECRCFFNEEELADFLSLARMYAVENSPGHYTRLLNTDEGFTPPGLLMGLTYAWYIDNRLATHIEYKMSLLKIGSSSLVPNQLHMAERRKRMIGFFRDVVFRRAQ